MNMHEDTIIPRHAVFANISGIRSVESQYGMS